MHPQQNPQVYPCCFIFNSCLLPLCTRHDPRVTLDSQEPLSGIIKAASLIMHSPLLLIHFSISKPITIVEELEDQRLWPDAAMPQTSVPNKFLLGFYFFSSYFYHYCICLSFLPSHHHPLSLKCERRAERMKG